MGNTRVKMKYKELGAWGATEERTLYCWHGDEGMTFYEEDGRIASTYFSDDFPGENLWSAMNTLSYPFKDEWSGELKDGVEYYYQDPWDLKSPVNNK